MIEEYFELRNALADAYPTANEVSAVLRGMNLRPATIDMTGSVDAVWNNAFHLIEVSHKLDEFGVVLDKSGRAYISAMVEEYRKAKAQGEVPRRAAPQPDPQWHGPEKSETLEKIIGQRSTLVSISYFAKGLERAKAVARVLLQDGSTGTGFVTDDNLFITNNHVLSTADQARPAYAQFNYERTPQGTDARVTAIGFNPQEYFRTSEDDDWTAVKLAEDAETIFGKISLRETTVAPGDFVNIVQHPGGGHKQISISSNVVAYVGHGRVQYLTDTMPGSSGSPVFNQDWDLIALHFSGGWIKEPNSKKLNFRNQGISIDRIRDGLA